MNERAQTGCFVVTSRKHTSSSSGTSDQTYYQQYDMENCGQSLINQCRTMGEYMKEVHSYLDKRISLCMEQDKCVMKSAESFKSFLSSNHFLPLQAIILTNVESTISNLNDRISTKFQHMRRRLLEPLTEFKGYLDKEVKAAVSEWSSTKTRLDVMFKNKTCVDAALFRQTRESRVTILSTLEKCLTEGESLVHRVFGEFCKLETEHTNAQFIEWSNYSKVTSSSQNGKALSSMYLINVCYGVPPSFCDDGITLSNLNNFLEETRYPRPDDMAQASVEQNLKSVGLAKSTEPLLRRNVLSTKSGEKYLSCSLDEVRYKSQSIKCSITHQFAKSTSGKACDVCKEVIEFNACTCLLCRINLHRKCIPNISSVGLCRCDHDPFGRTFVSEQDAFKYSNLLIDVLESSGMLAKDIYRKSPVRQELSSFLDRILEGITAEEVQAFPPILVASALKKIVRQIPNQLISFAHERRLLDVLCNNCVKLNGPENLGQASVSVSEGTLAELAEVVSCFEPNRRSLFCKLMVHLNRVSSHSSENNMNSRALAVIFSPGVFPSQEGQYCNNVDIVNSTDRTKVIEVFITHIGSILGIDHLKGERVALCSMMSASILAGNSCEPL